MNVKTLIARYQKIVTRGIQKGAENTTRKSFGLTMDVLINIKNQLKIKIIKS